MRRGRAGVCLVVAVGLTTGAASTASAQTRDPNEPKAQPLNLRKEPIETEQMTNLARARFRGGDCAGALSAFDAALRVSRDPTLHRDRGRCHEQLGQPYPAIDDYRQYLTAAPDAPDADAIRERLAALEQSATGRSSVSQDTPDSVDVGAGGTTGTGGDASNAGKAASKTPPPESMEDDDPRRASLRRGKGWAAAPFFSEHAWVSSSGNWLSPAVSLTGGQIWAECVGVQIRYSFGPKGAIVIEGGYEHLNSTEIDGVVVYGLTSLVAYEFRFPLDPEGTNQLFVAPGLGYQHFTEQPGNPQDPTGTYGAFVPRARFGWTHLLGESVALDVSVDAGIANFFAYESFPYDSNVPLTFLAAADLALVWGF